MAWRIFPTLLATVALLLTFGPRTLMASAPKEVPPTFTAPASTEAWRILIDNTAGGAIKVSLDHGANWAVVGRVTEPATRNLQGYLAAGYAPIGTVAATAVHGIRIRVGDETTAYPSLVNIVPAEFATTTDSYGGHISGASGIYTDMPAGTGIFREFAPLVGSIVLRDTGPTGFQQLPVNYSPVVGDMLMIVVNRPTNPLRSVEIENIIGGNVTVTYADGTSQVVTHVLKPVEGVGRFDGCSYTGVGAINTNHTCVITVSTAPINPSSIPEGSGDERRGGFQITPSYHNSQTEEASAPQMLVLGERWERSPTLEGTPPLFCGNMGLAYDANDPSHSWLCQIRHDGDALWQPMPTLVGNQPDVFTKTHVVAFRIAQLAGIEDVAWLQKRIAVNVASYGARRQQFALSGKETIVRSTIHFRALDDIADAPMNTAYVQFYLDGQMLGVTNTRPYDFDWDTHTVTDGEHEVEARLVDENGNTLQSHHTLYWVDNANVIAQTAAHVTGG